MVLRPTTSPPQARTPSTEPPPSSIPTTTKAAGLQPPKPFQVFRESAAPEQSEQTGFLENLKVPTVVLETPAISHTMAAALSLSLLGHILFLKNQVPFPVAQLSRMPGGKSNPKAAKKRDELVATFDTLASHLQTTFVALSTAYARCKSASLQTQSSSSSNDENQDPQGERRHVSTVKEGRRGTAHLMFVLGTSVGAARARILLTIDGLEVRVWGARPGAPAEAEDDDSESEFEEESSDGEDDPCDEDSQEEDSEAESDEDCSSAENSVSEEEDASAEEDSECESGPPQSRSPSPEVPPARSLAPSPEPLPAPPFIPTPLPAQQTFTFFVPPPRSTAASENRPPTPSVIAAPPSPPPPTQAELPQLHVKPCTPPSASREVTPAPELSYAQEQQALRAAERLLSRTLMNAWVNGEGDMSSELAPTQTQIFLRAPRRFMHPAWAARQNLCRSLDGVLSGFLEETGAVPVPPGSKKAKSRGVRTEGAWIGCRGGSAFSDKVAEPEKGEVGGDDGEDEEDEEIWWAWEGKIVGFADW